MYFFTKLIVFDPHRNSTIVRQQKKVWQNIMRVTSWATKYVLSFRTVADELQNIVMTLELASNVVRLGTGPGGITHVYNIFHIHFNILIGNALIILAVGEY